MSEPHEGAILDFMGVAQVSSFKRVYKEKQQLHFQNIGTVVLLSVMIYGTTIVVLAR